MEPRDLILSPELDEARVAELLRGYGFIDPVAADQRLQQIGATVGRPRLLARATQGLLESLERSADPDSGLKGFESLIERVSSPAALLSWLVELPSAMHLLGGLLGNSPFLSQILVRNPEYLYWLAEGDRLQRVEPADYFEAESAAAVHPAEGHLAAALDGLRRFKRRETLRIGAQDLMAGASLEEVVTQVSDLASAILDRALGIVADDLAPSCPLPAVLAMGKLGGRELNFSSDVDLVYVHPDDADETAIRRLARRFTRAVSESSNEGHLYRVDLRLRPMGSTGEISYSESATRTYYQTWADTTDRLALLKCRPVAGDLALGKRWIDGLRDFVFRRYLDNAAIEEIRWIKLRTDRQQRNKAPERNVKLGAGGIREVEFFVQALQLLYGGQQPVLQTSNTPEGLRRLEEQSIVPPGDIASLREAYTFLRRLEHRLQLVADRQTHHLPADSLELRRVARRMGLAGERPEEELQSRLDEYRQQVHKLFLSLFPSRPGHTSLQRLMLSQPVGDDEVIQALEATGIGQPQTVVDGFRTLASASSFPHSPGRIRNLLANLAPRLLEHGRLSDDIPRLLTRLDSFAEALGARGDLYLSLVENELLADRLFRILATSEFLSVRLIRHPELLDSLAFPGGQFEVAAGLVRAQTGTDSVLDVLRDTKSRDEFKIGAAALLDGTFDEAPARLSQLAKRCLELACRHALEASPELAEEPFALVALGKLGASELTLHSDLDIVVVHKDSQSSLPSVQLLPLIKSIRHTLHSYTRHGRAYEVDLRLRPEGRKGLEITPLSLLRSYFQSRADSWEQLAWRKRRIMFSHVWEPEASELFELGDFDSEALESLGHIRQRKESELGREADGHYDLKNGRGGLLDVHFAAGVAGARHGIEHPSTIAVLEQLPDSAVTAGDRRLLIDGFRFLTRLELALELLDEQAGDRIEPRPEANALLADALGMVSGKDLLERYQEVTTANRAIYERVLGR